MSADLHQRISQFLADAYSPDSLTTARDKLQAATELLKECQAATVAADGGAK